MLRKRRVEAEEFPPDAEMKERQGHMAERGLT